MSNLWNPSGTSALGQLFRRRFGLRPSPPRSRLVILVAGLLVASGCSGQTIDSTIKTVFEPAKTPQQQMLVAVSAEDPDQRREAVIKIAKSKQHDADWAIRGYIAIALFETDSQARCVAIRALARTRDPRAAETLIKILNYTEYPPQDVRPPEAVCRVDATLGLGDLVGAGAITDPERSTAQTIFAERLEMDRDRNVRLNAARGLCHYQNREAVDALVAALKDEDFGVVNQCEQSLTVLTGQTFACSQTAWETWIDQNQANLFAAAGQIPESKRPLYTTKWEQLQYQTKQLPRVFWADSKEE